MRQLPNNSRLNWSDEQHLLAVILDTVPDAMIVIDEHGIISSFSTAAEKLFGYDKADVLGENVSMLMPSPHREQHDEYIARYLRTGEKRIIGTGRIVEGCPFDHALFPMELYIGEGEADGHRVFTGFVRDMTERFAQETHVRELQAELAHASRLGAMGTLASSLAHELNQPLTAVANYMAAGRDLLDTLPEKTRATLQEALDEAAHEAIRAGQIVRRLRDFVAKGDTDREMVSVGKLIGDATTLGLVGAREKGIRWTIDIDQVENVIVDRIQIQQVLINLMRNAIEAMADSEEKLLSVQAQTLSDKLMEISVADTGCGLAPDVVKQLFQPFVSTKPHGMGLGLSICRTIVESHGGHMTAEANPGGGTIFRFTLSRAREESDDEQ